VTPVKFRGDLWHQKTIVVGVSCGVVCMILRLAVLVEHRLVTDGRTDRQTDRHRAMASTADAKHRAVKKIITDSASAAQRRIVGSGAARTAQNAS